MFTKVWKSCYASVCHLNFINERGASVDTLTGFKVNKFLVTSQHAFYVEKAYKVELSFVGEDANTITASIKIPYSEFIKEHRIGVFNNHGHYAIFNIDLPDFENIPGLELSEVQNFSIGSQVGVLAFSGSCSNLSLTTGIISSMVVNSQGTRLIQFDGNTMFGNSGAPLIDPISNKVIGIVSRRSTPASHAYQQLMNIISTNLDELKKVESKVKFGDIDPIQVLIANQNQLKHLATNIYKYSVSSISQAVTLDRILSFFNEDVNLMTKEEVDTEEEVDLYQR
jgi:hypothetical protein